MDAGNEWWRLMDFRLNATNENGRQEVLNQNKTAQSTICHGCGLRFADVQ